MLIKELVGFLEDEGLQANGAPFYLSSIYPSNNGVFYVSRFGCVESVKQMKKLRKQLHGFDSTKDVDEAELIAIWLAEFGVTGWENLTDANDNEVPFTRANCRQVFADKRLKLSLCNELFRFACNYEHYIKEQIIEDIDALKK